MILHLLVAFLLLLVYLVLSTIYGLASNYSAARRLGISIVVTFVSPDNVIWLMTSRHLIPILRLIPFYPSLLHKVDYVEWSFKEKYRIHSELGETFVLVTPKQNWIHVCNAETIVNVIQGERQNDYERPPEIMEALDVFGPNIGTANGRDWQRQRRSTAATFNEANNRLVWAESLHQGRQMLCHWLSTHDKGIRSTEGDVRTLALDVLLSAGFGKSYDFEANPPEGSNERPLTHREAVGTILDNAILILALGPKFLSRVSWPRKLARLGEATCVFKEWMDKSYEDSRVDIDDRSPRGNLMTSLVKASMNEKQLSRDEVSGNMFFFSVAGHDTTAHTMTFTMLMLAAHPEVQEWMTEEIRYVTQDHESKELGYDSFPKFKRCLAVLFETLRVYNPAVNVIKSTKQHPVGLAVGTQNIRIPPETRVTINLHAVHSHPRYWGDDAYEWKPSRWIKNDPHTECASAIDREILLQPAKGTYQPWSEGGRSCPGKKFAQVEHVAVMVALFRDHEVTPARKAGEDVAAAERRVEALTEDCRMPLMLHVAHPEQAELVWKKRSECDL